MPRLGLVTRTRGSQILSAFFIQNKHVFGVWTAEIDATNVQSWHLWAVHGLGSASASSTRAASSLYMRPCHCCTVLATSTFPAKLARWTAEIHAPRVGCPRFRHSSSSGIGTDLFPGDSDLRLRPVETWPAIIGGQHHFAGVGQATVMIFVTPRATAASTLGHWRFQSPFRIRIGASGKAFRGRLKSRPLLGACWSRIFQTGSGPFRGPPWDALTFLLLAAAAGSIAHRPLDRRQSPPHLAQIFWASSCHRLGPVWASGLPRDVRCKI
jgi:hypothetical protein